MSHFDHRVLRMSSGPTIVPGVLRWFLGFGLLGLGGFGALASLRRWVELPLQVGLLLGLALAGVGAFLLLSRRGASVDLRDHTVKTWWGLPIPLRRIQTHAMSGTLGVIISKEWRSASQSKSSGSARRLSYTVFTVRLDCGGSDPILLAEWRRYIKARHRAEALADALTVGVIDRTGEAKLVREAGTLDMSLGERLRRSGVQIAVPPIPYACGIKKEARGEDVVFTIPETGFGFPEYLSFAIGCFLLSWSAVFAMAAIAEIGSTVMFEWAMAGLMLIPGIALPVRAVKAAMNGQEVTISSEALILKHHWPLSFKTATIPLGEVEDLVFSRVGGEVFGRQVLLARSDRAVLVLGRGRSQEELNWLLALIQRTILANTSA